MPSIDNWPAELLKELAKEILETKDWKNQFLQQWPTGGTLAKTDGFVLDRAPEQVAPRDAVRIHTHKNRSWRTDNELVIRFNQARGNNLTYAITDEVEPEPEQPYKDDPRYGTWG